MPRKTQIQLKANEVDDFVGFEYENSKITIYYPMVLKLFDDGENHNVLNYDKDRSAIKILATFMRSFRLAANEDRVNDQSPNENDKIKVVDYPIEAYEFMIQDYQRNGRYIEFEYNYALNGNGKIDWKRTLRQMPHYVNGSPAYFDVVTKQKHMVSSIVNDIYMFCVYESIFKFGSWFYGLNHTSIPAKVKQLKPDLKRLYANVLESKLAETFNDDTANRLRNMLMIVNGAREDRGLQRMGLKSYHSVFERLIKWGLDNVGDLDLYNPRAVWEPKEENKDISPLRLDALRIENNTAYVIDAKFYQFTKPGAADINKQITYGENLYINQPTLSKKNREYDRDKIINIFISPKTTGSKELGDKIIADSGCFACGNWRTNGLSFEKVHLLYVGFNSLLDSWSKNNRPLLIDCFRSLPPF